LAERRVREERWLLAAAMASGWWSAASGSVGGVERRLTKSLNLNLKTKIYI